MIDGLRSRLGRKLSTAFLLSALFPVVLVSLVVYFYSASYVEEQQRRGMLKEAKLFETVLRERLHFLSELIESGKVDRRGNKLQEYFLAIEMLENPSLAVENDLPLLFVEQNALIRFLHKDGRSGDVSSYVVQPDYLFQDTSLLSQQYQYCVYSRQNIKVYCSGSLFDDKHALTQKDSSKQITSGNLEAYLDGNWFRVTRNFFPGGNIQGDNWFIVTSLPSEEVFEPIRFYQHLFAFVFVLTIFIVLLASNREISKLLTPLRLLTDATEKVSRQQPGTTVDISSGDELESLGDAFNRMSDRMAKQILTLQGQAELDRLIAADHDMTRIASVAWSSMKSVLGSGFLGIAYRDTLQQGKFVCCFGPLDKPAPSLSEITLTEHDEYTLLESYKPSWHSQPFTQNNLCKWAESNFGCSSAHYLYFPVVLENEVIGFVLLGSEKEIQENSDGFRRIDALTDRLAVSVSSTRKQLALYQQAHFDFLTGLPNRKLLRDKLTLSLKHADQAGSNVVVVFADLDNFKQINDSLGHTVGDQLLVDVSRKLQSYMGEKNLVAREGGDEFIMVFPEVEDLSAVSQTLEQLLGLFTEPMQLEGHFVYASMSLGVAVYPQHGREVERLLMNADTALYQTKAQGKSNFLFYDESMNAAALSRLELENALWQAIEKRQFTFFYQPLINLENRKVGFEALIRWDHPGKGLLAPGAFIDVAEETGLILNMGHWMFDYIFEQVACWIHRDGLELDKVAINVSPLQLLAPDFIETLEKALEKHSIPVKLIELEITESVLLSNLKLAASKLKYLHDKGYSLALDDFGTGYSSLSYLQKLPFDRIKIDRSFVSSINEDESAPPLVKSITNMAKNLDMKITAEGIEDAHQYEVLSQLGCQVMQGYHISRPIPAEEVESFLERYTVN